MDVAKPRAQPVQTLVKSVIATVTEVSTDEGWVAFDNHRFKHGSPLFGPHGLLRVKEIEPDKVILEQPALKTRGSC